MKFGPENMRALVPEEVPSSVPHIEKKKRSYAVYSDKADKNPYNFEPENDGDRSKKDRVATVPGKRFQGSSNAYAPTIPEEKSEKKPVVENIAAFENAWGSSHWDASPEERLWNLKRQKLNSPEAVRQEIQKYADMYHNADSVDPVDFYIAIDAEFPNFIHSCPASFAPEIIQSFVRAGSEKADRQALLMLLMLLWKSKLFELADARKSKAGCIQEVLRLLKDETNDDYFLRLLSKAIDEEKNTAQSFVKQGFTQGKNFVIYKNHKGEQFVFPNASREDVLKIKKQDDDAREEWQEKAYSTGKDELDEGFGEGIPLAEPQLEKSGMPFAEYLKDVSKNAGRLPIDEFKTFIGTTLFQYYQDDFNFDLKDLTLTEQYNFFLFVKDTDQEKIDKIIDFCDTFGINGLRTFLSLEKEGKEFGDTILKLGETLPEESAKAIFAKFAEFADGIQNASALLKDIFANTRDYPLQVVEQMRTKLLEKGTAVLKKYAAQNEFIVSDVTRIQQDLASVRVDSEAFLGGLHALLKNGVPISLEDVKDGSYDTQTPTEIQRDNPADIPKMKELYIAGYKEKYPRFAELVGYNFDKIMSENTSKFQIFRYKGEPQGFFRLENTGNKNVQHFGSFIVNEKMSGGGIGEAMMQQSLDTTDKILEADCIVDRKVSGNYIEKRGFIGTKVGMNQDAPLLYIWKNQSRNSEFITKSESLEDIIQKTGIGGKREGNALYVRIPNADAPDDKALMAAMEKYFGEGTRVLTRYIIDKADKYLVFEDITPENLAKYQTELPKRQVSVTADSYRDQRAA